MPALALFCALAAEPSDLKPFTLWQLQNQTPTQMMSYVIRTKSGQVIVIDGGNAGDARYLADFLRDLGDHVTAWFLTHPHSDHTDALVRILQSPGALRIDAIYASMPEPEWIAQHASELERKEYERLVAVLAQAQRTAEEFQLGQEFLIDGVRIEVLGIKNPEIIRNPINNQSVILKVTGADRSILFTADLGAEAGRKALGGPYADKLRADYIQMAHHGQQGVDEAFYRHVGASYCLWPTPLWLWENDNGGGKGSGPWRTLEVRGWMEKLPIKRNYLLWKGPELIEHPSRPQPGATLMNADFLTPNDFRGSDIERINKAILAAAGTGRRVVIPRRNMAADGERELWLLDSAILVHSDTTLELDNCHIKLSDRCRDNMIRSANCGLGVTDIKPMGGIHIRGVGNVLLEGADRPRATGDGGKTLGERTFGTDAGVSGESQRGDWRNIGILMAFVENFSIRDLRMKDPHCWGISLERCSHGTVSGIGFESAERRVVAGEEQTILNQDGVDLRLGCHDITIEDISGHSGDDLVALTAIPNPDAVAGSLAATMVSSARYRGPEDDIRDVIIRNVRGYCKGGHHIIRLLNTSGARMHDILIDGLIDTSPPDVRCKAAVKIGDKHYGSGVAPLGDTRRIIVTNVISKAQHTILIGGSLCDSVLSNILREGEGEAVTVEPGEEYMRDVTVGNVRVDG